MSILTYINHKFMHLSNETNQAFVICPSLEPGRTRFIRVAPPRVIVRVAAPRALVRGAALSVLVLLVVVKVLVELGLGFCFPRRVPRSMRSFGRQRGRGEVTSFFGLPGPLLAPRLAYGGRRPTTQRHN